ncbi:MAG TPA: DNA polymerase III subunit beta [Candidatus Paceibacterota bacterium]|nr:DNA polymerase III subunit beta [Candidatus Paceibacterota bacterium]
MVITIEKNAFKDAVHIAARFAERRSATLPALSGIAIVAGDDGIKMRATNLETGIDLRVEGLIKSEGVMVLPANILREVAGSLSGSGSITIEHAGDTAVITGAGKSTLKTLPAEDFPVIPIPKSGDLTFTLPSSTLGSLIGSVVACASTSTVRPELASVMLASEGGMLIAAASDSFRLSEKKIPAEKGGKPFKVLIPAKNAADILGTLPEGVDVTLTVDEHQCACAWKGGVITTRLVAAQYPDYTQIIPKHFAAEATVLRKDFEAAVRRVSVFSDSFQKVRLGFDIKGKHLVFSSRNSDVGESSEDIAAATTGEGVELSFNHRYLAAPLPLISTENLTLSSGGIGRPLVIRGQGDASFLYLVMPMNQ